MAKDEKTQQKRKRRRIRIKEERRKRRKQTKQVTYKELNWILRRYQKRI